MTGPQTLAERLVAARLARGWSQEEAATALRMKPPQLSKWERGVNAPGTASLTRLARAYGVTLAALLGESTDANPPPAAAEGTAAGPAAGPARSGSWSADDGAPAGPLPPIAPGTRIDDPRESGQDRGTGAA